MENQQQNKIFQKILHFPLTKIIISLIVILFVYNNLIKFGVFKTDLLEKQTVKLIATIIATFFAVLTYIYLFKFYEKRSVTEFGQKNIFKNLILGFVLGFVLQSLTILVIYLKGGYSIISINPISFIIPPLTMAIASSIIEEIIFRGILFRIIEEKLGTYISLIISALIFGLIHISNPNSSLMAGLGLSIQAGLLLGLAYVLTRNLWFPIMIHFAWNFTQSAIYGASVSGSKMSKTLITSEITGNELFTGGQFGPEGSIQATIFCLIATIVMLYLSRKKGRILKPYWKTTIANNGYN
jgi:membrane protease YdiL (CAAX protease family)